MAVSLTNYASQTAEAARARRVAQMLQEQAMAPIEEQTVNGAPVPISPYQGLAKLLSAYVSNRKERKADEQDAEIAKSKREEAIRFLTKDIKGSELTKFEDPATAGAKFMPVEQPKPQAINTAVPTLQNPSPSPQMQAAPAPQMYQAPQAPQATAAGNVAPQPEELQRMYLQAALSGNDVLAPIAADRFKSGQATAAALAEDEDFAQKVSQIPGLSDAQKKQIIATRAVNPQAAGNAMGAMLLPEKPEEGPSGVQEYKYAQGQGFKGSYMDFVGAKKEAGRAPPRQAASGGGGTASGAPSAPAKPGKTTQTQEQSGFLAKRILNSAKLISDTVDKDPSSAGVGLFEAAAGGLPLVGDAAERMAQSANRQAVSSAQDEIIDSALTLATGAAYTKEQAKQKRDFYKPNIMDKPELKAIKQERVKQLIQDAKTRSGPTWTPEMDQAVSSLFKPQSTPKPSGGAYSDAAKEARYQEFLKNNSRGKPR